MVGTTGFEPATSSVSRKRSNQLSYAPASKWPIGSSAKSESPFSFEQRANQNRVYAPGTSPLGSLTGLTHTAKPAASAGYDAVGSFFDEERILLALPRAVGVQNLVPRGSLPPSGLLNSRKLNGPSSQWVRTNVPCPITRTPDSILSTRLRTYSHSCASVWRPFWFRPSSRIVMG